MSGLSVIIVVIDWLWAATSGRGWGWACVTWSVMTLLPPSVPYKPHCNEIQAMGMPH